MPRGSRALLTAEIRARREPKLSSNRCSLGLLSLSRAFPCTPWKRLPVSFPRALSTPLLREKERPALQGLAEHASRRTLAGRPALLRFATRTHPRLSPTTVAS
jgi:hypothetical protein